MADAALALLLMAASGAIAGAAHASMDRSFLAAPRGNDVWFEGDLPQVADTILHRWSNQPRNDHHPLYALFTTLPAYVLKAAGFTGEQRLTLLVIAIAALWCGAVFALMRMITPARVDAVVFTLVVHASAAAIFWLPVTDTFALGSTTILVPLCLVAWACRRPLDDRWFLLGSVLSLGVTTSNWTAGIAAALSARRARHALQITANALAMAVVLWAVQSLVAPLYPFFIAAAGRSRFLFPADTGGPLAIARVLLVHAMVMPALHLSSDPKWGATLSVQHAAIGSSGAIGAAATALWLVLLAAGLLAMCAGTLDARLRNALLLTLAAQCAVYLCYGEETFLYVLHVAPLLVSCAAVSTRTKLRPVALTLAATLFVLLTVNNLPIFMRAASFFAWGGR